MSGKKAKKKIILVIIDSFHPGALQNCLDRGLVPAMSYLIKNGNYNPKCVSTFPTVTPTASSSIITGLPPSGHQVAGFVWFDRQEKRIINYGSSSAAIFKMGVARAVYDILYNLNHRHLSGEIKTVYEILEEAGYSTGAVNTYIFRSKSSKQARIPFLMRLLSNFSLRPLRCSGPGGFYLGRLCQPEELGGKLAALPGYIGRWGINDRYAGRVAAWLIGKGRQPDLMTVYFPDNDYYCHSHDPSKSEESIIWADRQLARILDAFPSREKAVKENIFILAGDHSQSMVSNEEGALVSLPDLFREHSQVGLGERPASEKDMAICPNGRMAQIYILNNGGNLRSKIVSRLLNDKRVDQVFSKDGERYNAASAGGEMKFWRGGDYRDETGGRWGFEGDPGVLAIGSAGQKIKYGAYPDALHRVASFMDCSNAGDIVATAKPGFEFIGEGIPGHRGTGSHGSLHRDDSTVPLIISGIKGDLPHLSSITDMVPFIKNHFGLAPGL